MTEIERKKFYEVISYLFFGVLTTVVNYVSYYVFTRTLGWGVTSATSWAWVLAVLFAFVTNKIFVFHSRTVGFLPLVREVVALVACRLFSGVLDVAIMWLCVERLAMPDMWVKIGSNVLVVVINYVFSKLFIFKAK